MNNMESSSQIEHVTDTALWVAVYRATETKRPDALFQDPFAELLVGSRGKDIENQMNQATNIIQFLSWSVVMRTCVIDQLILEQIKEGIDTVVNLGAGLDTRPYRLNLPSSLRWIEIDFPHMIKYKEEKLKDKKPHCVLERRALDLSDNQAKKSVFSEIASRSKSVLIITEGVIPYLKDEEVASLAEDLRQYPQFKSWIIEYFSQQLLRHMKKKKTLSRLMVNAPLRFFPSDWLAFFQQYGWKPSVTRYLAEESEKRGRPLPTPWWAKIIIAILPPKQKEKFIKNSGFVILKPH